jgi:hypothetical protein
MLLRHNRSRICACAKRCFFDKIRTYLGIASSWRGSSRNCLPCRHPSSPLRFRHSGPRGQPGAQPALHLPQACLSSTLSRACRRQPVQNVDFNRARCGSKRGRTHKAQRGYFTLHAASPRLGSDHTASNAAKSESCSQRAAQGICSVVLFIFLLFLCPT